MAGDQNPTPDEQVEGPDAQPDGAVQEAPPKKNHNNRQRPERQAARYRVERNQARQERDEARLELAFTRAAGALFVDASAAFKLADRGLLSIDPDGVPVGVDESIEALAGANPFLLAPDDGPATKVANPFKDARPSGRVMNGPKKPQQNALSRKQLEARYPALRRGR